MIIMSYKFMIINIQSNLVLLKVFFKHVAYVPMFKYNFVVSVAFQYFSLSRFYVGCKVWQHLFLIILYGQIELTLTR